jgi:prepilin-type N-terminal cleavage/methylation domain-containing protein
MRRQTGTVMERRSGFTLLELLVVIVVISVLMALLLTVFGGVFRNVDVTRVKADFTQLDVAMKSFESDYGVIPPSAIVLIENPDPTSTDPDEKWQPRSKSLLRKMFGPNVDFSQHVDFNGDGDTTDLLVLTSSECLVFFLGGIRASVAYPPTIVPTPLAHNATLTGFSGNKEKPFSRGGDNRIDPPITLDTDRFVDNDGDGMPEYKDAVSTADQSVPMLYASSNNGQGYSDTAGSVAHYHQSDGSTAWNENSFQLISPGEDGEFGFTVEPVPFEILTWSEGSTLSVKTQRDNIANFAPGTLGN